MSRVGPTRPEPLIPEGGAEGVASGSEGPPPSVDTSVHTVTRRRQQPAGRSQAGHCGRHYEQTKMSAGTDLGSAGGERQPREKQKAQDVRWRAGLGRNGGGKDCSGEDVFHAGRRGRPH